MESIGDLPAQIAKGLADLREQDKATRLKATELSKAEAEFLEEVKGLIKEHGSNIDEASLQKRAEELMSQRQELSLLLDEQMKKATGTYDVLDEKIKTFDSGTKDVAGLLIHLGPDAGDDNRNRKKKRKSKGGEDFEAAVTNEPSYCTCRRQQYGEMIACENSDCEVEWFHLSCVNLKEAVSRKALPSPGLASPDLILNFLLVAILSPSSTL